MVFSIRESYLIMYRILDHICWETNDEDETLMNLLGNLDPSIFIDSMSADSAAWEDWCDVLVKTHYGEMLSPLDVLSATIDFMHFHQNEFGFPLDRVIERLKLISIESPEWSYIIDRAIAPEKTRSQLLNYGGFVIAGETVPKKSTVLIKYACNSEDFAKFSERGLNSKGSFCIKIPLYSIENNNAEVRRKVESVVFTHKGYKPQTINLSDKAVNLSFHGVHLGLVRLEC